MPLPKSKTHGEQFGAKERHDLQCSGTEAASGMFHVAGIFGAVADSANAMVEQLTMTPWKQTWKTNAFPGLEATCINCVYTQQEEIWEEYVFIRTTHMIFLYNLESPCPQLRIPLQPIPTIPVGTGQCSGQRERGRCDTKSVNSHCSTVITGKKFKEIVLNASTAHAFKEVWWLM